MPDDLKSTPDNLYRVMTGLESGILLLVDCVTLDLIEPGSSFGPTERDQLWVAVDQLIANRVEAGSRPVEPFQLSGIVVKTYLLSKTTSGGSPSK